MLIMFSLIIVVFATAVSLYVVDVDLLQYVVAKGWAG